MSYDAIVFDLGNTLVPWGEHESRALFAAVHDTYTSICGPTPDFFERLLHHRDELLRDSNDTTMREVTVEEFVNAMCENNAPDGLVDAVSETIHTTFLEVVRVPDGLPALLDRLGEKRPLAVLSNFLMTQPIDDLLENHGLKGRFVHVEVSATHGYRKPHPAPFERVREKVGTAMERTLMVGDDFWADIVGGHRAGFVTALTHEHRQDATSDPRAPDIRPDRVLQRLDELADGC